MRDPASIVAALQRAADALVSSGRVEAILTDEYNRHDYEHVYWHPEKPALGKVAMMASMNRLSASLSVEIYYGQSEFRAHPPLPNGLVERLIVHCQAPDLDVAASLRYNQGKQRVKLAFFGKAPLLKPIIQKC